MKFFCFSTYIWNDINYDGSLFGTFTKEVLLEKDLNTLSTATTYLYSVVMPILILSLTRSQWGWPSYLLGMFSLSGILFSGSLFAYVFTKIKWLVFITPIGGALMIVSWLCLLVCGVRRFR